MKNILIILLLISGFSVQGQTYQNSWINYNQTYYKFSVISNGLYRIPQSVLQSAGLGNVPAEQFQLWRNGEEQPIFVSNQTGVLGATDYIEFYGIANDGKPDKKLYRKQDFQLSDYYSLISDTSSYFLTVTTGATKHFMSAANDVSANVLPAEKYFMNKRGVYFNTTLNLGYALPVGGVYLYSAAYDEGEGWTSQTIPGANPPAAPVGYTTSIDNLNLYTGDPSVTASLSYAAAGSAFNSRNVKAKFNDTYVDDVPMPFMDYVKRNKDIPLPLFTSPSKVNITFYNTAEVGTDRMVVSYWDLVYPSTFNFNNATNFYFELPQNSNGNYLEITNFNSGGAVPVLYDQSSLRRYVGDISTPGIVKFALPPSFLPKRSFRLVSESSLNIKTITSLTQRKFIDYSDPSNQGNYIIISNPLLYSSQSGSNYVEQYRQYRNSPEGGGYRSIIVDINELTDQFAYGIYKHPLGIKEFIQFAFEKFNPKPRFVFLVGKGVSYDQAYKSKYSAYVSRLNLVPTFGSPGSDNLLASEYGGAVTPKIPIGRLSAVSGDEVGNYLEKIKEYEGWQKSTTQTIDEKLWMKNVMQIIGGSTDDENGTFRNFMFGYKMQLEDSLLGMHVEAFSKTTNAAVQTTASQRIEKLFEEGVGIVSYFGHSSASILAYNLDAPESYNNPGKYPLFIVSGCTAGNNFTYDSLRIEMDRTTISEDWVLSKKRGSIGFMASSHYGIPFYLNDYNRSLYDNMRRFLYGAPIGVQMKQTVADVGGDDPELYFYTRADAEEMSLNGDPAIKVNSSPKPDYVMEDRLIKIDPSFISVSNQKFTLIAKTYNIGKAVNDSIIWEIKRTYPDGKTSILYRKKIIAPYYSDSVVISVPIISSNDKGLNKITITVDADNDVDEMSESNNAVTKEFFVFEDEATPAYPQNFAIINKDDEKMYASTANPLSPEKDYIFQIDTTALFNSTLKVSKQISSKGGIIEFDPGIKYVDSTVYYWRVMVKSDTTTEENAHWNNSSFIYLKNSSLGVNQSDYYQHLYSDTQHIRLNDARKWEFSEFTNTIQVRGGVYPTALTQGGEISVAVNGGYITTGICATSGIVINIIDPMTMAPWENTSGVGRYGSIPVCTPLRVANFHYNILNETQRLAAYHFLNDSIPDGSVVVIRSSGGPNESTYVFPEEWKADTAVLGSGKSLYHLMLNNGFSSIDSFNRPRGFIFMYQKNVESFVPVYTLSKGISDKISVDHPLSSPDSVGFIRSPKFGPVTSWTGLHWNGYEDGADQTGNPSINVIGIKNSGEESLLLTTDRTEKDVDLSSVNATEFPFLRLEMRNADSISFKPYQLSYWRINYVPAPEGAIDPSFNINAKDTLTQGEPLNFAIGFKNISAQSFDSVSVKVTVIDKDNVTHVIVIPKQKPLVTGDTIQLRFTLDTKNYTENNTLYVEFNPDNNQPESNHSNNFIFYNFYVKPDIFNPLMDVTFDGVHILNRDIVSAKPHIVVKLKDENRFMRLTDTALIKVQLKMSGVNGPDILRTIPFDNDTLRFTTSGGEDNTATIDYTPQFQDADNEYELIVSGKDVAGNKSGSVDYHVTFRVINKAMITELLNYPNPFTTSTAFVFTLTGSEVPQNLRIQILTVTGKVVREITKEELGPLHIGRNITEFKWDGTDSYGQPLANGVYLYRVLTNLNGKSLEKFNDKDYQLDPNKNFFRHGYGKMYLMR